LNADADELAAALPPAALPAWQAYRRMLATKDAHFVALADAEQAANAGLKPRLAQQAQQAALLEAHSAAVAEFRATLQALDAGDRAALVALLGKLNEGLVPPGATSGAH
jgi:hypothetical protein